MLIKSNISLKIQDTLNKTKVIKAKDCKLWLSDIATKKSFVTVRIVSEKDSAELNKHYRKIDKPTNILSFLIEDNPLIGDLILCHPIIKKEAKEQELIFHTIDLEEFEFTKTLFNYKKSNTFIGVFAISSLKTTRS